MRKRGFDVTVYSFAALFVSALFLAFPELVTESVSRSLSLCATRVIPAVFPFSVLSSFFIHSGGVNVVDRVLRRPFRFLFGLRAGASAFLCGLFFGFPLGAMTAGSLYKNGIISSSECQRLLCFTCCASPTFPVFSVGRGMFGSIGVGFLLWGAQAVTAVIIGVTLRLFAPVKAQNTVVPTANAAASRPFPELLTVSVGDASRVMLSVCGSVTFFSLIAAVLSEILVGLTGITMLGLFVSVFFEFASGCAASAEAFAAELISRQCAIAFSGFAIGFSGLSVLCQNSAVVPRGEINLYPHIFCKMISGIVTAVISYSFSSLIPDSVSASTPTFNPTLSPLYILPSLLFFFAAVALSKRRKKISTCKK